MTCPYQLTCVGFSLPGDNACGECVVNPTRPDNMPPNCKKSHTDWRRGAICNPCDKCDGKQ